MIRDLLKRIAAFDHWMVRTVKAISSVAIYGWSLIASVDAVNTYYGYHHEAAGGLAAIVILNPATLAALVGIPCWSYLSRRRGFAGFSVLWAAAAAMGCLQVLLLVRLLGL